MSIRKQWHINREGQIVVALNIGEMHAIVQAFNITINTMSDNDFYSCIGKPKEVAQRLLDELLAIVDAVDPPRPDD